VLANKKEYGGRHGFVSAAERLAHKDPLRHVVSCLGLFRMSISRGKCLVPSKRGVILATPTLSPTRVKQEAGPRKQKMGT